MDIKIYEKTIVGNNDIGYPYFLVEVQATDFAPITLHHSSVIIQVPHPSKLDNVRYKFHTCIKNEVRYCQRQNREINGGRFGMCVLGGFLHCINNQSHQDHDLDYLVAKQCELYCNAEEKYAFYLGLCLLGCYTKNHL